MTKEEMIAYLSGKKPEEANSNKVTFTKCGVATEEQAKYIMDALCLKDEQESARRLSGFLGDNCEDTKIGEALKAHAICVAIVTIPPKMTVVKECVAFSKEGYILYGLRITLTGLAFGVDKDKGMRLIPWDAPITDTTLLQLSVLKVINDRKNELDEKISKEYALTFNPRPYAEVAEAVIKATAEVQA